MTRIPREVESYLPDEPLCDEPVPLFQKLRPSEESAEASDSECEIDWEESERWRIT